MVVLNIAVIGSDDLAKSIAKAADQRDVDLPQEPLLAEAELLEAQIQALMESAGGPAKPSSSSNAMLYG